MRHYCAINFNCSYLRLRSILDLETYSSGFSIEICTRIQKKIPGVNFKAVRQIFRECIGGISSVRGGTILVPTSSMLFGAFWCTTIAPSHAGMPTHILLVNGIDRRSGEVAHIIVIGAVIPRHPLSPPNMGLRPVPGVNPPQNA